MKEFKDFEMKFKVGENEYGYAEAYLSESTGEIVVGYDQHRYTLEEITNDKFHEEVRGSKTFIESFKSTTPEENKDKVIKTVADFWGYDVYPSIII